jgi:hypothetical protein
MQLSGEGAAMNASELIRALEYAPKHATTAAGLRGWWHKDREGLFYICAGCAARILARGCSIGPAEPVWRDAMEPHGVCVTCGGAP